MARAETTNPWRILGLAVLAQFGVSVVDQGLPTLNGFVKAELGVSPTPVREALARLLHARHPRTAHPPKPGQTR